MNFIILFINKTRVVALTPALQPIDGVAVSYIDAAVALGNTINEMDKYYTQENYKDDAFAKGKTLHQTFLKNLEAFEPVAESYHAAIQEINDKRQLAELKNIEEREGKTFHYYSLACRINKREIHAAFIRFFGLRHQRFQFRHFLHCRFCIKLILRYQVINLFR